MAREKGLVEDIRGVRAMLDMFAEFRSDRLAEAHARQLRAGQLRAAAVAMETAMVSRWPL